MKNKMKRKITVIFLSFFFLIPLNSHAKNPFLKVLSIASPVAKNGKGKVDPILTGLIIAHSSLQVADYTTTRIALSRGGREANPIMAPLFRHEPAGFAFKMGIGVWFQTWNLKQMRKSNTRGWHKAVTYGLVIGLSALQIYILQNNIRVIRELR